MSWTTPTPTVVVHPQVGKGSENGGWGRSGSALCSPTERFLLQEDFCKLITIISITAVISNYYCLMTQVPYLFKRFEWNGISMRINPCCASFSSSYSQLPSPRKECISSLIILYKTSICLVVVGILYVHKWRCLLRAGLVCQRLLEYSPQRIVCGCNMHI